LARARQKKNWLTGIKKAYQSSNLLPILFRWQDKFVELERLMQIMASQSGGGKVAPFSSTIFAAIFAVESNERRPQT